MLFLRSFPLEVPAGRAYVEDGLHRHLMHDYDYSGLAKYDSDLLLIEWDVAASLEMLEAFAVRASLRPNRVLVAPYRLAQPGRRSVWAHRYYDDFNGAESWITGPADYTCDLFGLGLVYLPRLLVRQFCQAPAPERGRPVAVLPGHYTDRRFTDQTFSMWHHKTIGRASIDWSTVPVHLHC